MFWGCKIALIYSVYVKELEPIEIVTLSKNESQILNLVFNNYFVFLDKTYQWNFTPRASIEAQLTESYFNLPVTAELDALNGKSNKQSTQTPLVAASTDKGIFEFKSF